MISGTKSSLLLDRAFFRSPTMQLREPTNNLTGVAETLMITLYARAIETQRPEPIVSDPKAVEIAEQLDYDFSKYQKGWASQLGCVIRVRAGDRMVQNFLETHPSAIIVNPCIPFKSQKERCISIEWATALTVHARGWHKFHSEIAILRAFPVPQCFPDPLHRCNLHGEWWRGDGRSQWSSGSA
jgi:hypothetical protein